MYAFLKRLKENLDKKQSVLSEEIDLSRSINNIDDIIVQEEPFRHIVVDNFFKDEVYQGLTACFREVRERGIVEHYDLKRFSPFLELTGKFQYDGYKYVPRVGENTYLDLLYSATWNLFFSELFQQTTGLCTSCAFHYHPPGNKTGFVHHDYATKWFSPENQTSNKIITYERVKSPLHFSQIRTIAILYYLNNDGWVPGDGGGTGLYREKSGTPCTIVEPKNNRLLAFQISPKSFHAFQQNKKPRSCIVQWFHTDPTWCNNRYGFLPND